jgi:hypothetical protein
LAPPACPVRNKEAVAALPELSEDQWTEIVERLTHYAACRIIRHTWRGLRLAQGGSVPGGVDPSDLAADAITGVIEGKRAWNQTEYPVFLDFLRSVVDSRLSHLVGGVENRTTRRTPATADDGETDLDMAAPDPDPAVVCLDKDALERFRDALVEAIGTDSLLRGLLSCLESDMTKPEDIATVLDVTVKEVNNAKKRLQRKATAIIKTSPSK